MSGLTDAAQEILKGRYYATLATHNDDGSIHTTPVWYVFENGKLYVGTSSSSLKCRNLAARPRATLLVDTRNPGSESWVCAAGRVEILTGDASREINARILRRYLTEEAITDSRVGPIFAYADDVTICLVPEVWRSWRATDLDEKFFGGVLGREPEKWFRKMDD